MTADICCYRINKRKSAREGKAELLNDIIILKIALNQTKGAYKTKRKKQALLLIVPHDICCECNNDGLAETEKFRTNKKESPANDERKKNTAVDKTERRGSKRAKYKPPLLTSLISNLRTNK